MAMNPLNMFQQPDPDKPLGGRYKVISQLAAGGFGQTFVANDLHMPGHPQCVVKQFKPQVNDVESLQTARRLFDTEAQVLYNLGNHDQIPRLLAHFEDNADFYLAQELIEGEPLSEELLPDQPWPEGKVIALVQDILNVLAFVHQQQVIHRDIKPSNLIRRRQDGRIVLIDFGAVKQVSTQILTPKTGRTNMTISIGTHGYMPKEQLGGNPRFSSDVYAVGMVGLQALTGVHPRFLGEDANTGEIIWRDRVQQVTTEFAAIVDKMICYDFRSRYISAADALQAIRNLPPEVLASVPPPQPLPYIPSSAPTQALQLPVTATGATAPIGGVTPQTNPVSGHSTPTISTDSNPIPRNSAPSKPTVATAGVSPKSSIKPWQIISGVLVLGASFWSVKTIFLPKTPQTASNGSSVSAVNSNTNADPKQATELLSQADRLREAENYSEAITAYEKAIALNAKEAKAHWGLCYSLNQMGKPEEAIAACDRAIALKPDYPEALSSKSNALYQQQNYSEALKLCDQALKLDPKYAEAWNNRGVTLLKMNKFDQAYAAFDKATQFKPDWPDAWANRGNALQAIKRYDEAFTSLEKAIALDSEHPNANNLLQKLRRELGRYDDDNQKSKGKSKKEKGKK